MEFTRKVVKTLDGSCSISVPELNEHYHSTNGAVQESVHVFIKAGLHFCRQTKIKILEIGFGTGLNAILTLQHGKNLEIDYHAIEAYPLSAEVIGNLNYPQFLNLNQNQETFFRQIHCCANNTKLLFDKTFMLTKYIQKIEDFQTSETFNIIYFDAFAPEKQPELWSAKIFEKMYTLLKYSGLLVTYCAKGQVRRNMQQSGLKVERLPGPPGKREMLRAIKLV